MSGQTYVWTFSVSLSILRGTLTILYLTDVVGVLLKRNYLDGEIAMVGSTLRKASDTYQRDGLLGLLARSIRWIYRQAAERFWNTRGFQPFSVGNVTAEFNTSNRELIDEIRQVYRMERGHIYDITNTIHEDDTVYDIGAHIGVHAAFAANAASEGTVVAFEPDPTNADNLQEVLKQTPARSHVFRLAISDDYGTSEFKRGGEAGSQIGALVSDSGNHQVATAPLDGVISDKGLPSPNVVKIDVEGAEPLVLKGMRNTLASEECFVVFIEVHLPTPKVDRPSIQDFDSSVICIMETLRRFGYEVKVTGTRSWVFHLKATKTRDFRAPGS